VILKLSEVTKFQVVTFKKNGKKGVDGGFEDGMMIVFGSFCR